MKLSFYTTATGAHPVRKYLDKLEAKDAALVLAVLQDIALNGLEGSLVEVRCIQGKLYELKITRHRIFYVMIQGPEMILLHAYKKESQKAPRREIEIAEKRMREVLAGRHAS
ncbi:MAG TPA: type II toxin-antitoxin system RelE/ParE family toxin [Polyangia bacterium]|nr:type II toxin-antitoxin system RelE/ParE family toxin [Polyangia bacterium]